MWKVAITSLVVVIVALLRHPAVSRAQGGIVQWSEEVVLFRLGNTERHVFPVIAADPFGQVHVFWAEGQAIYYTCRDQGGWSAPIDVVWSSVGPSSPSAAVDSEGILHLVWAEVGEIHYRSAPAWTAANIRTWSADTVIQRAGGVNRIQIAIGPDGSLHVVFADWYGNQATTVAGNVYYCQSLDRGKTWSDLEQVSVVPSGELATDPRLDIDKQGRVHIVWGQFRPSEALDKQQQGVYYARLADGEIANYLEVAHRHENTYWITAMNVAIANRDEVHLIWVESGNGPWRHHTWSDDGGDTWADPQTVFGDLYGLAGWDALVADAAGTLYWIATLRYPQAMYYSDREGARWADSPAAVATEGYMKEGHDVRATVGLGNQIHLVAQLGDAIVYVQGSTAAPALPRLKIPAFTPTPTGTPLHTAEPDQTILPHRTLLPTPPNSYASASLPSEQAILGIGVLPVILLIVATVLIRAVWYHGGRSQRRG